MLHLELYKLICLLSYLTLLLLSCIYICPTPCVDNHSTSGFGSLFSTIIFCLSCFYDSCFSCFYDFCFYPPYLNNTMCGQSFGKWFWAHFSQQSSSVSPVSPVSMTSAFILHTTPCVDNHLASGFCLICLTSPVSHVSMTIVSNPQYLFHPCTMCQQSFVSIWSCFYICLLFLFLDISS